MPYRRLPNTDNARLKALRTALNKGKEIPPFKLAFRQGTLTGIQALLPNYENTLSEHKASYNLQLQKSKDYHKMMKKAKMYISHFIQIINMSIQRGEMSSSIRKDFGLTEHEKKLPDLSSEVDILSWGNKLIEAEQKRRMKGLSPVTNPTIAVVKIHVDNFKDACLNQGNLKKRVERAQESLASVRNEADTLIQQLWNEVEDTFKDLPEDLRRHKASEYGVVYVFRKNELKDINLFKASHVQFG
ncbi:MAG: hypothetical protein ACP5E3_04955 [Bacteroidales bacterium]